MAAAAHKGLVELDLQPKQAVEASAFSETASVSAGPSEASASAKVRQPDLDDPSYQASNFMHALTSYQAAAITLLTSSSMSYGSAHR